MAIGIIIGIVLAIVMVACVITAICLTAGVRPLASVGNRKVTKKPLAGGLTAGGAVAAFVLFLFIPFSFHTVQAGEVAVVKHLGDAQNVRTAGTYFDFWVTEKYETYDAKVQNLNINANTYSKDGQSMQILINVQYQMDTSKALLIANNYGGLSALSTKIQSVTEGRAKAVLANYSAMEVIETRADVSVKVENAVKEAIDSSYYVTINTVVLTNIDFTDAFEKTVEDKMIAEQEKLKAQYEKETAIINAEKELEVAKKQAEAKIEVAKADAQAQVLVARAEANAIKAKSIEVARALGFTVKETLVESGEGDNADTEVEYEIDFTGKSDAEIKLITEYLKYIEYLAKWDGKLPEVMLNDGNATIMIPTDRSEERRVGKECM